MYTLKNGGRKMEVRKKEIFYIDVVNFQSNGWTRWNVYWRDGTREELFERKWRQTGPHS